jgi:UDP-N-acetylenolpyruvoylglucosamine reductase
VIGLMKEIQERVAAKFGVPLTPEPVFVGFDSSKCEMEPAREWQF